MMTTNMQWPLIGTMRPELRLLNLHFFNICRHHPTLKFKPHATDDERYVSGIDGVPLIMGWGSFSLVGGYTVRYLKIHNVFPA